LGSFSGANFCKRIRRRSNASLVSAHITVLELGKAAVEFVVDIGGQILKAGDR
jgi:hypothetical protein